MTAFAVDLGGTYFRSAVVGADGVLQALRRTRLRSVFDGEKPDAVWDHVISLIGRANDEVCALLNDQDPLVIAFPGPIADGTHALAAPTLTGATPPPSILASRVAEAIGRPVRMINDVAAATRYLASQTDDDRFLVVTVSSGIGSRVFLRGAPLNEVAYAGEIGHLAVDVRTDAVACDCGGQGHLGAIASGRGVEREARRIAAVDPASFSASLCAIAGATSETLRNETHILPAVLAGDIWATAIVQQTINPLARVIRATVVAAGLQRVYVIGGFATALGDKYRELLVDALESLDDSPLIDLDARTLVRVRRLDDEACLRGAALTALGESHARSIS